MVMRRERIPKNLLKKIQRFPQVPIRRHDLTSFNVLASSLLCICLESYLSLFVVAAKENGRGGSASPRAGGGGEDEAGDADHAGARQDVGDKHVGDKHT